MKASQPLHAESLTSAALNGAGIACFTLQQPKIREVKPKTSKVFMHMEVITTDGSGKVSRKATTYGRCQKCGCTDFDCSGCIAKTGQPCSWTDDSHTLCSACVT
jgi:hypothetical protein